MTTARFRLAGGKVERAHPNFPFTSLLWAYLDKVATSGEFELIGRL
jgi:hypothetical protein